MYTPEFKAFTLLDTFMRTFCVLLMGLHVREHREQGPKTHIFYFHFPENNFVIFSLVLIGFL